MITLIVFANQQCAKHAGFRAPTMNHPQDPRMMAWWPSMGSDRLRGLQLGTVMVTDYAMRYVYDARDASYRREFQEGMRIAKDRLRLEPKVWMEL